jgi:hypothetical protein
MTVSPALQRYAGGAHVQVDGWLSQLDADIALQVALEQRRIGLTGSVGEIGIHHGRLFILLALTLQPGETAFAVDIFDDQSANLDASGFGDEAVFRRNMAKFGVAEAQVAVIRSSSTAIGWPDIAALAKAPARFFSIDGGHTSEITENDMAIADAGLEDRGVVILDDWFNPEFPAVSEGACRHLIDHPGRLVPFVIGDNKVLFCRPGQSDGYRAALRRTIAPRLHMRTTTMFGAEVEVYATPHSILDRIRQSDLADQLRDHPLGRKLKPIVRRIFG